MSFAQGKRHTSTMTVATIERNSRLRSSIRCEMNVSWVSSGAGDGSLMAEGARERRNRHCNALRTTTSYGQIRSKPGKDACSGTLAVSGDAGTSFGGGAAPAAAVDTLL